MEQLKTIRRDPFRCSQNSFREQYENYFTEPFCREYLYQIHQASNWRRLILGQIVAESTQRTVSLSNCQNLNGEFERCSKAYSEDTPASEAMRQHAW